LYRGAGALTEAQRNAILAEFSPFLRLGEIAVKPPQRILTLLDEAYEKRTWHGPNLKQSIRGVTPKQAAWRPGPRRHNIWELTLHAAYWKYALRRRIEGGKRGSFALKGSNFFARPEKGKLSEAVWRADKELLEREHRALCEAAAKVLQKRGSEKLLPKLWGIAFHDIYHAGQIRLLRRLMGRGG
jgi:DinB family protein